MASATPSQLQRQIACVSRRLFVQSLLDALITFWSGALLLAAAWCVAEPHVAGGSPAWLRWAVAGGIAALATRAAFVYAVARRPWPLDAALSLDQRFGLKERITTSVSLTAAEKESPAGLALLADAEQHVARLNVRNGYPFAWRWTAALLPVSASLLALAALLYHPNTGQAKPIDPLDQPLANAAAVEKQMKKLEKKPREQKKGEKATPEAIQQFEDEMDKLTVRPRDNRKQAQELAKDATALEEKMMNYQRGLMERKDALKEQLQQMDRFEKTEKQKGPAEELQKAMQEGNLDKAKEEIEKLAKKLEQNKLIDKDQEQLEKQIEQVKEKMKRLADQDKEEERLQELARKDGADAAEIQRQLDQLRKNKQKLMESMKDLQEAADQLERCQQCLKQGQGAKASQCLRKAGEKLENLAGDDELRDLEEQLNRLQGARKALCKGCEGDKGLHGENSDQDQSGSDNPVQAAGRRPESKEGPTGKIETRTRGEMTKGELRIEGFEKGFNLKRPKKSSEIAGEIKQASQEAPEAIDRLRIPKAVGDISKGYFENLRRDSEKESEHTERDK
jgi:hypothetical protein